MAENTAEGEEMEHTQAVRMISVQQIDEVWSAEDPLQKLFDIFMSYFNPSHDPEFNTVDDNKIKLLAEYQIYNLIFLKNDIKLEDFQSVHVLDMLWNMLAVNQDGTIGDHSV